MKAAPEGVLTMKTKQIEQLPALEVKNLQQVCIDINLPNDAFDDLQLIAIDICRREAQESWKSAPARRKDLKCVSDLAKQLNKALQGLDYDDMSAVHMGFKGVQIRMHLDPADPVREAFYYGGRDISDKKQLRFVESMRDTSCENVMLIGDVLLTLESIVGNVCDQVVGQETGRKPRNDVLSSYIENIANCANLYKVNIARGGQFHTLCESVFLAAGISTDPDAAIRKFIKTSLPVCRDIWLARQVNSGG